MDCIYILRKVTSNMPTVDVTESVLEWLKKKRQTIMSL